MRVGTNLVSNASFENVVNSGVLPGRFDGASVAKGFSLYASVDGSCSIERMRDAANEFKNSLRVTVRKQVVPCDSDYFLVQHDISGSAIADLGWGSKRAAAVTLEFWVKSSVVGTYVAVLRNFSLNRNYCAEYQIFQADVWEFKSIDVPGDCAGVWVTVDPGVGIFLGFVLGGGQNFVHPSDTWSDGLGFRTEAAVDWIGHHDATFQIGGISLKKAVNVAATASEELTSGMISRAGVLDLDENFSAPIGRWEEYLDRLFGAVAFKKQVATSKLWIMIDARSDCNVPKVRRTLESIERLAFAKHIERVLYTSSGLPECIENAGYLSKTFKVNFCFDLNVLLEGVTDDDRCLFVVAGDELSTEFLRVLYQAEIDDAALATFDLWFAEDERAYPLLAPGANSLHAVACNYFFSRFLMVGRAIRSVLSVLRFTDPYHLAREIFQWEIEERPGARAIHVPLPLVKIDFSRGELSNQRLQLIQSAVPLRPSTGGKEDPSASVSVVILTKDKGHLLRQLVGRLTREALVREVIIIANQTTNPYALQTLKDIASAKVKVIENNSRFNFSALCNQGARESAGEFLLFMNDDIVPIGERWLEELMEPLRVSNKVAVTGPLLLYPNETVQHGGMYTGFNTCCGHTLRFAHLPDGDYSFYLSAARWVSAVTGAAMLFRRDLFNKLNGFDEMLGSFLQDLDICLRANRSGFDVAFNPRSILLHMESVSSSKDIATGPEMARRGLEHQYFMKRWSDILYSDKFHPPILNIGDEGLKSLVVPQEN